MRTTFFKRMCLFVSLLCMVTALHAKTKTLADFKASDYGEIAKAATFGSVAFENTGTVAKNDDGHVTLNGSSAVVDLGQAYSLGSKTKVHVTFESTFPNGQNFQIQFFEQTNNTWADYKWSNKGNFYRFRNNPLDTSDKNGIGLNNFTYTGDRTWNSRIAWSFDFDMEKATVKSTATPYVDGVLSEDGKMTGERTMGLSDLRYFRLYVGTINGFSFDNLKVTIETEGDSYVAYLYDSSRDGYSLDNDEQYFTIQGTLETSEKELDIKAIDTKGDISVLTADSLVKLQGLVLSGSIGKDNAIVPVVKNVVGTVPVLNCNPQILEAWGWAKMATASENNTVKVTAAGIQSGLFKQLETNGGANVFAEDSTVALFTDMPQAYELDCTAYLKNDRVLLTAGNLTLISEHNAGRNTMLTLPWLFGQTVESAMYDVFARMFLDVTASKRVVISGTEPAISETYKNNETVVTLSGQNGVDTKIYYTLDGSEPTTSSTLYTEPFSVTSEGVTVKAIALPDGYTLSPIAEKVITIKSQAASPKIEVTEQDGQTIVMLSSNNADDVIAFTYRQNTTDPIYYQTYTEPIILKHPKTISAIVKANDELKVLQSEPAVEEINVNNEVVRNKVLAHFDADPIHYAPGKSMPYYYIGKTDLPVYTNEVLSTETLKDQTGADSIVHHYAVNTAAQFYFTNDTTGWRVGTGGVVITSENTQLQSSWGLANSSHYTPWDAQSDTEEITNNAFCCRTVSTKNADGVKDPGTAYVQTVKAYPGPFNVVTFACGYNSPVEIFVSSDTTKADGWKKIGEAQTPNQKLRGYYTNYMRSEVGYEETTPVFVKLVCAGKSNNRIFDVYLYGEDETTGINTVKDYTENEGDAVKTEIFNTLGQRTDKMTKGVNIIKYTYADGKTGSKKVILK